MASMLMRSSNRVDAFRWMSPKYCPRSWLLTCLIPPSVRDWWAISLRERPKVQRGNILVLLFAENVRLHCWQKATRRRRFGSNTSGMRSPEGITQIRFVGISGVLFRAKKAAPSLREFAPNTRPFKDVH